MAKLSVAVLFLLFTLSLARTPSLENDVTHLKLPSENDVTYPKLPKTLPESEETRSVDLMRLNFVRFRPINRRFPLRSNLLPFRRCHHMKAVESRRQIPFGNDMILSSTRKNIDFDKFVYRTGVQIPSDWFDFHNHKYYDNKKMWRFVNDREKFWKVKLKDQSPHKDHQQKMSKFLDDWERFGEVKLKDQLPHHHHHHDEDNDNEDNDQQLKKMSKFLDDRYKYGEMTLKDQLPHHNEDNDHQQGKMSKFEVAREDRGNFGEIKSKNDDEEDEKRSKLYGKHHETKLRKRFRYKNGEEEDEKPKEETKWHKKEKKKGGFMRGIHKFLHHYFG